MDNIFLNHLKDLSLKSEKNCRYTFTHFLTPDEQSLLKGIERQLTPFTLFGGANGCERVVARFGDPDELGYAQDFPIACIKAAPKLKKFADTLTHRDFLGALMSLGIERKTIGDITLKDGTAYIFVLNKMAEYICENLTRVKHTVIEADLTLDIPKDAFFTASSETHILASDRLDCMIAAVYKLSRNRTNEIFTAKKVFINGRLCENTGHIPKSGDTVSVRGFGRFIFSSVGGTTKKGRLCINIEKFI